MSMTFTSNEFCMKARQNGLSQSRINSGAVGDFLHENAIQCGTKRTWRKKSEIKNREFTRIEDAVAFLKSQGYKVLKPINEWLEL